jgi:UDP-N-acetyl-D-glucosamine dehydrogenase
MSSGGRTLELDDSQSPYESLLSRILARSARTGVIGLGYVGLPLAISIAQAGFPVVGFDIAPEKVTRLNAGDSYIDAVTPAALAVERASGRFVASADFSELATCDVIILCVPTPLTRHREPDLSFVQRTAQTVSDRLRKGQLVVLESTTYPGTTETVVIPLLEQSGLKTEIDFFVGFSPEREDPGNRDFALRNIPKVVAGNGRASATLMKAFYGQVVKTVVPVSTTATAEAVKLTENIFRSVNIALVNELKIIFSAMNIDIWEVIEAAKSKPFGYMPFYPGPGLGGHCIPIDPFYLTWKAREYELTTRFIELAGEINTTMPAYVVTKLAEALDLMAGKALSQSRILIAGLAYKKNVADIRESPALRIIELIEARKGKTDFHDPHVDEIPSTREHVSLQGRRSIELTRSALESYDAVVIVTDHEAVDYSAIAEHSKIVVDTRNVMVRLGLDSKIVIKG